MEDPGDLYIDGESEEWVDFLQTIDKLADDEFVARDITDIVRETVWEPKANGGRGSNVPTRRAEEMRSVLPDALTSVLDRLSETSFTHELGYALKAMKGKSFGDDNIRVVNVTYIDSAGKMRSKKRDGKTLWRIESDSKRSSGGPSPSTAASARSASASPSSSSSGTGPAIGERRWTKDGYEVEFDGAGWVSTGNSR
jgi:hypothetical protein